MIFVTFIIAICFSILEFSSRTDIYYFFCFNIPNVINYGLTKILLRVRVRDNRRVLKSEAPNLYVIWLFNS